MTGFTFRPNETLLICIFCLLFVLAARGQSKLYQVTGNLIDAASQKPIEYGTIALKGQKNNEIISGTVTDDIGFFRLLEIPTGTYVAIIDVLSYETDSVLIVVNKDSPNELSLGNIPLRASRIDLQAVTITARRDLIENKVDKLVYNVEQDITSQGGLATDILRKIPQVSVDINGNVEILGNPSVRFLINGRPSTIFGNSIADALQSIPASQIQSIEVISSPGAKYDATGTGGIINIIMKKSKSEGLSGTANATIGTRQENGALNINYKNNGFGLSGFFNGSEQLKTSTINQATRISTDPRSKDHYTLAQDGLSDFVRKGYRTGINADWDINEKESLSFTFSHNSFGTSSNGYSNQNNSIKTSEQLLLSSIQSLRNFDNRFNNSSFEGSSSFLKKFSKEKKELSLWYNLSIGNNNTDYTQSSQYESNDSLFLGSKSSNPGKDYLHTFSFNYSEPLSEGVLLEIGTKAEIETLISNANVSTFSPESYQYFSDDKQSYTSTFNRQVYAGYASASFSLFNALNVISGIRLEHTINHTKYSKDKAFVIPDYNNLGPTLTISHNFKNQQLIKFSYAYRLERPEYRDLNPFINLADPHNIYTGNPDIKPEIGNDFQLTYNQPFGKENNLNVVLVYTYNSPDIKPYTSFYPSYLIGDSIYSDVSVTRRDNIASETRWGVNIAASFNEIPNVNIRINVQLYDRRTEDIRVASVNGGGFEHRTNINVNYKINKNLYAEAFGNYRSGIKWQGRRAPFASYTLALRHQLGGGKGSIGLTTVNAFGKYLSQKSTTIGDDFTSTTLLKIPYRSIGLSMMYKFGKIKVSKIKEDDNFLTKPPEG